MLYVLDIAVVNVLMSFKSLLLFVALIIEWLSDYKYR